MGVTVKDILKLSLFKDSKVIAGKGGLNNIIKRASVFDCPIQVDRDKLVLEEGDFFVTNFFFLKDNLDYAISAMNFFKSHSCSGLCVTNEYIDYFCNELIIHCNKIDLPIITVDHTISYWNFMRDISCLINSNKKNTLLEIKLTDLINSHDPIDSNNILRDINPHLSDYVTAMYCYSNDSNYEFKDNFIDLLNKNKKNVCIPYKNGLVIIVSYSNQSLANVNSMISYFTNIINENVNNFIVGISNNFINLMDTKDAISQALLCSTSTNIQNCSIIHYDDLGSVSLLYSCKDTFVARQFHKKIIDPIASYDKRYNKNLLNTLIAFIECNGDFHSTANKIFQHENTVRYRIAKIKSILGLENSVIEFYERVSIAIKLHKMYH